MPEETGTYHGDGRPEDAAVAAAMKSLYRQLNEQELPGDPPFDVEAGLRDLKERLAAMPAETRANVPPWYVPDTEGTDLRPDPDAVTTPAGLLRAIRMYHTWSGNPSAQTLARRCRHRVSAAQFSLILNGQGRLTLPVLRDLVAACGTTPEYWRRFEQAWRRVAGETGTTGEAAPVR